MADDDGGGSSTADNSDALVMTRIADLPRPSEPQSEPTVR
jgi:hypothetical protein